jgi:hypothetical protein
MVIREIPQILAISTSSGLIRRKRTQNWPKVLRRFARSHADHVVPLAVSDTRHLSERLTMCHVN